MSRCFRIDVNCGLFLKGGNLLFLLSTLFYQLLQALLCIKSNKFIILYNTEIITYGSKL